MKSHNKNAARFLIFMAIVSLLFGCGTLPPTATSVSSGGPTIDEAMKEDYMGPKARITVTRFDDKSAKGPGSGQIGDGMATMLAHALFATNRFIVLERQSLGGSIYEQDLGASGRVRPETAPPIGELEGADINVEGTITEFEPGAKGVEFGAVGGQSGKEGGFTIGGRTSHIAMIVRMVENRTGRWIASEQVEGKATDTKGEVGFKGPQPQLAGGLSGYANTPMEKAIRIAINQAVKAIVAKTPANYYRVGGTPQAAPQPSSPTPPSIQRSP